MRTTVTLESDVAAAVKRMQKERSIGVSQAINELIRRALARRPRRTRYEHRSREVGLRIDVTNVAEAIELLEGPARR